MDVKIWNDNIHPYKEKFKGIDILIEPKQFIKMERTEAILFMGQFAPMVHDVDGNSDPRGFKKLRMEDINSKDR